MDKKELNKTPKNPIPTRRPVRDTRTISVMKAKFVTLQEEVEKLYGKGQTNKDNNYLSDVNDKLREIIGLLNNTSVMK